MIISVSSLKGGVGKSTITQNLAVCFSHMGYSVFIADTDANQSCMYWIENRDDELPSIIVGGYEDGKALSKIIPQLESKFDIVLIDGTPSLSEVTSRIILLSDFLIIPILSGAMDIRATEKFIDRYEKAVEEKGQHIPAFILLNQFDKRLSLSREVLDVLKEIEAVQILKNKIGYRVAYKEANIKGLGVYEYGNEKAKDEITKITNEVLSIIAD